jgi:hypothetical protein
LWEAVAADPTADQRDAERRAIGNFGDQRMSAAQFAVLSLAKRGRARLRDIKQWAASAVALLRV